MKICLWKYLDNERNFPGYHLSANAEGAAYIRQRLNDSWKSSSISLVAPDADMLSVPNNQNGQAKIKAASKLKINIVEKLEVGDVFIQEHEDTILLTLTPDQLPMFLQGVNDIEQGSGDYAMGKSSSERLWFWWQ